MLDLKLNISLKKSDFDLHVNEVINSTGITVIWGESGSGKSLLLRSIAGYEQPAGDIALNHKALLNDETSTNIKPYLRHLGYVAQDQKLFPHLTVKENLLFAYKRANKKLKDKHYKFEQVIEALGIDALLDQNSTTLSGGERQRCAIAQSLLSYPKVLLMDEPLSALDSATRQSIIELLAKIPQQFKMPIIYVTHAYEELLKLADKVLLLKKGKSLGCFEIGDFCSNYANSMVSINQLSSLLTGEQLNQDEFGLSKVNCSGQYLYLPKLETNPSAVELVIYAKDVSISLDKPQSTSILNLLEAKVEDIVDYSSSSCLIKLNLGDQSLLSLITKKSLHELQITSGQTVIAQIKSISFIR